MSDNLKLCLLFSPLTVFMLMLPPGHTGRQRQNNLKLSVPSSVHGVLKTNEPTDANLQVIHRASAWKEGINFGHHSKILVWG